jgi:hypothetical protein
MSGFKALINQIELLIRRLTNLDCYLGIRDGIMISSLRGPNMKKKKKKNSPFKNKKYTKI